MSIRKQAWLVCIAAVAASYCGGAVLLEWSLCRADAAFFRDAAAQAAALRTTRYALGGILALAAVCAVMAGGWLYRWRVSRPAARLAERIGQCDMVREAALAAATAPAADATARLVFWCDRLLAAGTALGARYRLVLDAVPDPLFLVDAQRRVVFANKAFASLAGGAVATVEGRRCDALFPAGDRTGRHCPAACGRCDAPASRAGCVTCETDGGVRVFRPVAAPVADGQGTSPSWLYMAQDVTAQVDRENALKEHLRRVQAVNAGITSVSQALNCGIASILGRVEEASDGARQQQLRVEAVQRSMHQMTAAAGDVSDNARAASGQAAQARESASLGERAVSRAAGAIDAVRAQAQRLRENMAALQRRTKDIGGILTVISDIADQTNLLALNAAIEAARAGTEGRGFAVVADEVRKLAEKTMRATGEVNQAIAAIQEEARRSQGVSETAAEAVDEAAALSARAGAVLADIVAVVDRTAGQVHNIAAAARQQSKASEDIDLALRDVTSVSANTVEGMSAASEALENLSAVAGRLRRAVAAVEAPEGAFACRDGQGEPALARGQLV